ncbi:aliphatic sulfonate ABC transporter substrate-binding protein [Clostridium sp. NSJ-145]|uniref:aliphatic sulfonate ABC transporter substrate-binding protein n=1 Tax=Clostridium sp. NSJ-145 TaxID=2897777 RepID=UPI001E2EB140|nr:aliphatic sulfonate ABC transporter substrate-binding protein [Clostridium sp. NSJ-145]MCD2502034.1 aliphatic sulfonate ABC transporter substrate-binding protein [Clostridium sp. NSJ-145]
MKIKKLLSLLAVGIIATGLFAGCSSSNKESGETSQPTTTEEKEEPTVEEEKPLETVKMKIAYHPNMGGASAMVTGIDKGYFEEQGLEIELVKFTAGPPEVAAMVSGDIDVGYIGHGAHLLACQGQVKLFALDCTSQADELLVNIDSGIAKIEDLKGKTIATQLGTSGEVILNLALESVGLTREDVEVVNMEVAGAVTAFISGQVDAVSIWSPNTNTVREALGEDKVVKLASNEDFTDNFVFPSSWVVTEKYASENRDVLVRFTKALLKSMDYRNANIDESAKLVAKQIDADEETILATKNEGKWLTSKEVYDAIKDGQVEKWYKAQQDLFIKEGKLDKEVPVTDYFDSSILTEAYEGLN